MVVIGIVVYRIVELLLVFRVLNFIYGEVVSEKLGATLREMFIGAVWWLVANLLFDECLICCKEMIVGYLM